MIGLEKSIQLKVPLLTHLRFRWTLPLTSKNPRLYLVLVIFLFNKAGAFSQRNDANKSELQIPKANVAPCMVNTSIALGR